ncbi:MAG: serine hydrolase domain-containing protein, partial [Bacteroidota bacterium]
MRHSITIAFSLLIVLIVQQVKAQPISSIQQEQIDVLLSKFEKTNAPGAAVAITRKGEKIYQKIFGYANLDYAIMNSEATVFDLMSVAKQFAGFGIALLVDRGQLTLTDDIRKYLPEVPDFGHPITIAHLLHHTSGIRDFPDLRNIGGIDGEPSLAAILKLVERQTDLNFSPGSAFTYSNTGYNLLAIIIERVSSMPFQEFMQQEIFTPLGMNSSMFRHRSDLIISNAARGYDQQTYGYSTPNHHHLTAMGSSALLSTIGDMIKWVDNFRTKRVGGEAVHQLFLQPGKLNTGEPLTYAFGIDVFEVMGNNRIYLHTGAGVGFRSLVAYFPDSELGIIICSNNGAFDVDAVGQGIAGILLGDTPPSPPQPTPKNDEQAYSAEVKKRFSGHYFFPPMNHNVHIYLEDEGVYLQPDGRPAIKAQIIDENTLYLSEQGIKLSFQFKSDGEVENILAQMGDQETTLTPVTIEEESIDLTSINLQDYIGIYASV